jgi:7,8-dihydroneopterin aldolase/epimerase/oxygenase
MKNVINIEGMRIYAFHGCREDESYTGSAYLVDVYIATDFSKAAETDSLEHTVDYCKVYELCKKEMGIRSKLIEHACRRIFDAMKKAYPSISHLRVKLTKLDPPISGDVDRVSVVMQD